MRAAVIHSYGEPPVVEDFPDPVGREDLLAVDVLAAALNPVDLRIATGTYHGLRPELPYVTGREAVVRLPDGTRAHVDGPPPPYGTAAEKTLAHPEEAIALPDGVSDGVAASLGVAGPRGVAGGGVARRTAPGDRVLVLGATGVVGLIAVQAARLLGAGRVVAAGRDPAALERAREAGADAVVDLRRHADLAEEFTARAEGPLDVVIDPLWGDPARAAMRAMAPFGRLVQLGQSAAPELVVDSATVRGKPIDILGHTNGAAPAEPAPRDLRAHGRPRRRGSSTCRSSWSASTTLPAAWARQAGVAERQARPRALTRPSGGEDL
jgi:NADPH2:quinone reductase